MSNDLSEKKKQQIVGLGRLGWSLRRIERETGLHRKAAARYLSEAGIPIRKPARPNKQIAKPAISTREAPHGSISLSDGRRLHASKRYPRAGQDIGFSVSNDDGSTGQWLRTLPTRPGDNPERYHELHAIEVGHGRLLAPVRNHNPANERETLQSESSDGGKSWSIPRPIGVWGLPSHLLRLRDGRLLIT